MTIAQQAGRRRGGRRGFVSDPPKILDDRRCFRDSGGVEITLPPEWEKHVVEKVADGAFASAEEVVRESLRRLFAEEKRAEHLRELRVKIQEGIDASEREEGQDGDEFFAELDACLDGQDRHPS